jgi:restriction endonuclease S subunit
MRLGEMCDIRAGHSDRVFVRANEKQPEENVKFLTVKTANNPVSIEWEELDEYGIDFGKGTPFFLQSGDIVFEHKGTRNRAIHIADIPERTVACAQLWVLRLTHDTYRSAFLAWWLNQPSAKQFYLQHYRGKSKVHLTQKDFKTMPIPTYTDSEQEAILAHVQQVELEIRTHYKLIRNRERYLEGLMQTLVKSTELGLDVPARGDS